jgi:hypothetical protein
MFRDRLPSLDISGHREGEEGETSLNLTTIHTVTWDSGYYEAGYKTSPPLRIKRELDPQVVSYLRDYYVKVGGSWINPSMVTELCRLPHGRVSIRREGGISLYDPSEGQTDLLIRKAGLADIGATFVSLADAIIYDPSGGTLWMENWHAPVSPERSEALAALLDATDWMELSSGWRANPDHALIMGNGEVRYSESYRHDLALLTPGSRASLDDLRWFALDPTCSINLDRILEVNPAALYLEHGVRLPLSPGLMPTLVAAMAAKPAANS